MSGCGTFAEAVEHQKSGPPATERKTRDGWSAEGDKMNLHRFLGGYKFSCRVPPASDSGVGCSKSFKVFSIRLPTSYLLFMINEGH